MAKKKMKLTPKEQAHVSKGMKRKMVDVHGNPMSPQRKLGALYKEVSEMRKRGSVVREAKGPSKDVRRRPKLKKKPTGRKK